jgi:hypothetical protein
MSAAIKGVFGYALAGLLATGAVALWSAVPSPGHAADDQQPQQLQTQLNTQVSWGTASGCVQNIATNHFGSLTPSLGTDTLGPFDALPHASASTDAHGSHVWVGCVTANGALGVSVKGIHDMTDGDGHVLPLSDVAIGVTNQPGGHAPAGCAIDSDQSSSGGCTLPHDGSTNRALVNDLAPGTTELQWQYQLNLAADQPAGDYSGGTVVFTATATDASEQPQAAPTNTAPPTVSGGEAPDYTLMVSDGTWTGSPTSFSYQWSSCDQSGNGCTPIDGATASSFVVPASMAGRTFRADVTATNGAGSGPATSAASVPVLIAAPVNGSLPLISPAAPLQGSPMTVTTGSWSNSPTSYAYQWQRCSAAGDNCVAISGATSASYTPGTADASHKLLVRVTATNAGGSATASSDPSNLIPVAAPVNTVAPTETGTRTVGQTLSTNTGSWTGNPTISYTYQWQRDTGSGFADISGATGSFYILVSADIGNNVRVRVTATNSYGSLTVTATRSGGNGPISGLAPENTSKPAVTGTMAESQTLTATKGTWTADPTPSYSYQWVRCSGYYGGFESHVLLGCSTITGATATTYALTASDVGFYMGVDVTAVNSAGSAMAESELDVSPATVAQVHPSVSTAASVSGGAEPTKVLTASASFAGQGVGVTYQWTRCDTAAGANCVAISGATSQTYTVAVADLSKYLRVTVTGSNGLGTVSTTSALTSQVQYNAATNTTLPAISGTAAVGQTLTASTGTWSSTTTVAYSYQWVRCDGAGANCVNIASATTSTYSPVIADAATTLRVKVTATNTAGPATASSATTAIPAFTGYTAAVLADSPSNLWHLDETSSASPAANLVAPARPGTYAGTAVPGSAGVVGNAVNANGGYVSVADNDAVDLKSGAFTIEAWAKPTTCSGSAVSLLEKYNSSPFTGGYAMRLDGCTLRLSLIRNAAQTIYVSTVAITPGLWHHFAASYDGSSVLRLYQDGAQVFTQSAVSGPTDSTVSMKIGAQGDGQAGRFPGLIDEVAYYTTALSATQVKAHFDASGAQPVNTVAPAVMGSPGIGQTLTASTGTWSNVTGATYAYQWQTCDTSGANCANVSGATTTTYVVDNADAGKTIRVNVTATATGSATASSAVTAIAIVPGTQAAYYNAAAADGPVTYYPLNDNASTVARSTTNALYNGTWTSAASTIKGAFGDTGGARAFTAAQHVFLSSTGVGGATTATTEFWMYWDGTYPNGTSATVFSWDLYNLYFNQSLGALCINTNNGDCRGTSSAGLANGWHHITVQWSSTAVTTDKIWVDSQPKTLTQIAGTPQVPVKGISSSAYIGAFRNTPGPAIQDGAFGYSGRLDEFAIYNGTLSQAQISSHYAAGLPDQPSSFAANSLSAFDSLFETTTAPGFGAVVCTSIKWCG